MSTEAKLESKFVQWCNQRDIKPIKGPTATSKGFPDRFLQLPSGGGTIYIEFKGDNTYYSLSPLQEWWARYIRNSNPNRYFIVDSDEALEHVINMCEVLITIGAQVIAYEQELIAATKINK